MEKREIYQRIAVTLWFAAFVLFLLVIMDVVSGRYEFITPDGSALIIFLALFIFALKKSKKQKPS